MAIGIATILIVFFEVLMRYVFRAPLITSVEIARLGFVWSCFLGAALGVKRASHVRFVFFLDRWGPRGGALLRLGVSLLCTAFFGFLVLQGVEMTQRVYETFFPALGYSQLWLYLPLPVSAAVMVIHGVAFVAADLAAPAVGRRRKRAAMITAMVVSFVVLAVASVPVAVGLGVAVFIAVCFFSPWDAIDCGRFLQGRVHRSSPMIAVPTC